MVVPPKPADTVVSVPTESVNCESKVVTISTGQDMNLAPVFWSVLGVIVLGAAFLIGSFFWRRRHPVTTTEE